jgi:hypothetical protein
MAPLAPSRSGGCTGVEDGGALGFFPRFGRDDAGVLLPVSTVAGGFREGVFFVSDMGRHSARPWPRR